MNRTVKRLSLPGVLFIIALFAVVLVSCDAEKKADGTLTVVATIFPVYDMARAVGGDHAAYEILIPPGTEVHSFEPTPKDIKTLHAADIFIYSGAGLEPWVDDLLAGIDNADLVVVDASAGVQLLEMREEEGHNEEHHEGEGHAHSVYDPHYWLDFDNAAKEVDTIAAAFIKTDAEHAAEYGDRAESYKAEFGELDALYRNALADCLNREIVSSGHFSFGYLAHRYNLSVVSVFGISPDAEPTPKQVQSIIELIRDKQIQYIFAEEMVEPRVAETIREETGVGILYLNPGPEIPRDEFDRGVTLVDIMDDNLQQLKQGLQCHQ